jgi:type II secretory pathway component PulK
MNRIILLFINNYRTRKEILTNKGVKGVINLKGGYILLIVLVISAFLVTVTSDFFLRSHTYIGYFKRFRSDAAADYLAYSGLELAKAVLDIDRLGIAGSFMPGLNNDKNIDTYNDIWALDFPEIPIMNGTVKFEFEDENSKINLSVLSNDLVEKTPYFAMIQRLFLDMGLPLDLADSLLDWVDPDDFRSPYGAESSGYYLTLTPPYSAKNEFMDSITELLLVKGFTPEIVYGLGGGNSGMEKNIVEDNKGTINIPLDKIPGITGEEAAEKSDTSFKDSIEQKFGREKSRRLDNYFRVHGDRDDFTSEVNKININTASFRILMSLTPSITEEIAGDIIKRRQLQPFKAVSEINTFLGEDHNIENLLTVKSQIFRITVTAYVDSGFARHIIYFDRLNRKILAYTKEQ